MDAFDYQDEIRPSRSPSSLVWTVATGLILLATLCVVIGFLAIFINPQIGLNPFKPPTLPALVGFPTPTQTPRNILPPTWTPTISPEPTITETPTPLPTEAETPTPKPTQEIPVEETPLVETPEATISPEGMPYEVPQGEPVGILNIGQPNLGCNWMGVAGQAIGMNEAPVVGLFVQLGGTLQGNSFDRLSMTGTATQYGAGGYEFALANSPVSSNGTLSVQLFDQAMLPLSEKVFFDTYDDCEKNLILINFKQVR